MRLDQYRHGQERSRWEPSIRFPVRTPQSELMQSKCTKARWTSSTTNMLGPAVCRVGRVARLFNLKNPRVGKADDIGMPCVTSGTEAANKANSADADVWRRFSGVVDEGRLRWCDAHGFWLLTVDYRHRVTNAPFDVSIREAKNDCESSSDDHEA